MASEAGEKKNNFSKFMNSPAGQIVTLIFLLIFLFLILFIGMSFTWDAISTYLDNFSIFVSIQAIKDWRFYVITIVLLIALLSFYIYLRPKLRLILRQKIKEILTSRHIIFFILWVLGLVVIASLLRELLLLETKEPAIIVASLLKRAPIDWRFYGALIIFVGTWLCWRSYLHDNLRKKLKSEFSDVLDKELKPRGCWVYSGFRNRALSLRTKAGLTLGSVFALLLGGIYLILFILPQIEESDRILREQTKQKAIREALEKKFGDRFRAMLEGRYWFPIPNVNKLPKMVMFSGDDRYRRFPHSVSAANKEVGLIRDIYGGISVTLDGGETWQQANGKRTGTERTIVGTLSGEGKHGLFVGEKGSIVSVSIRQNDTPSLQSVNLGKMIKEREQIVAATLSDDGEKGLLVGDKGSVISVFMNRSGEPSLKSEDLGLKVKKREQIVAATLIDDGDYGLLVGDKGSVISVSFGIKDRISLIPIYSEKKIKQREQIAAVSFSNDGRQGLLIGDKGSVISVSVKLQDFPKLEFVDFGKQLQQQEQIVIVTLSDNGKHGLVAGNKGSIILVSVDENSKTFLLQQIAIAMRQLTAAALSADGKYVLLVSDSGRILRSSDSGHNWYPRNFPINSRGRIIRATLSNDGERSYLLGRNGQIFMTPNGGRSWKETKWDGEVPKLTYLVSVPLVQIDHVGVAMGSSGKLYILKSHPDLAEWNKGSLSEITKRLHKNKFIKNSFIINEIQDLLGNVRSSDSQKSAAISGMKNKENEEKQPVDKTSSNNKDSWINIDDLTAMRIVTMTILFFLVQLLVRLYQYNMRLANFWESRADAMLLQANFAENKAERFDDLVQALAPDTYDFKPLPRSTLSLPGTRRDS